MAVSTLDEKTPWTSPFEAAFDLVPRFQFIVARTGEILAINRRFGVLLDGMGLAALGPACRIEDLFHGEAKRLGDDLIAAATGPHLFLRLKTPTGSDMQRLSFRVTPLRRGTRADSFFLSQNLRDPVTRAFKDFNMQLQRANRTAAEARRKTQRLQASYRDLEQFSHAAAHDLQAPLRNIATIISFVEEDYETVLPPEARDMLSEARRAACRLQELINSLLTHAKSSAAELTRTEVPLDQAVCAVVTDLSRTLDETGGRVETDGPLGVVAADAVLLHQLLANLVGNAIKYRHPARAPRIHLARQRDADGTQRLVIRDNGLGFDEAQRSRLFEPFQRQHVETGIPGSGIGLTICRTICDRHGWRIEAFGKPDAGARFEIVGIG